MRLFPTLPLRANAVRLAAFYAAFFVIAGVHLPYWPVWLSAQGLSGAEIGTLLAAATCVKIVANPLFAQWADRRGARRGLMVALTVCALAAFACFGLVEGFWPILLVTLAFGAALAPVMPLGENLAMGAATEEGLDYGRVRLWGSVTFMLAAFLGGRLLEDGPAERIYWGVLAGLVLTVLACRTLPDRRTEPSGGRSAPLGRLLRAPLFVLFLVTAGLVQASHAVYYGFSTLHWRAAGIGEGVIGLLWAEGVLAEIVLFAYSGRIVRRVGVTRLLALAAALATLRWAGTAFTTEIFLLIPLQALHAFSFAACHLAAMHFIARALPATVSATGQSLYSAASMGAALALAMLAAGTLYEAVDGLAYLAMAAMTAVAAGLAVILGRRWNGAAMAV